MLNFFRKHNKIILAFLGVLLMLSWLVLPALDDIFKANSGSQSDPVAVTWKGGKLTRRELQHMKMVHNVTVGFINLIMQKTVSLQGTPRAPGHPQPGYLGIQGEATDQGMLQTMILAQRAKELGVKISDESVKNYLLENVGDHNTLKEGDLAELVGRATPDSQSRITQSAIFEHLKLILLAQQAQLLLKSGVDPMTPGDISPPNGMPVGLLPPTEMWQVYEKLNRKVTIEAYPIRVADYLDKVTKKPTDAELHELFEKGRRQTPNPVEKDPAFRQPFRAAFEYVNLEFTPFLEAAKKQITDEQILAEYEKGKAAGNFKAEDPPLVKPETKPGDPPADKATDDKKPADDKKPVDDKKPEDKSGDKPVEKPTDKPVDKPADAPPAKAGTPTPKKTDGSALPRDLHLVSFQEDPKKQPEVKPAEPKPGEKKPDETKPGEVKPAAVKPNETKPADPAAKPGDPAVNPADPTAKREVKPGDPVPPETKPAEPKEIKFKTLDEVREDIRTQLARPIATEERTKVVTKILSAVNEYGRKYNRWKGTVDREKEAKEAKGAKAPKDAKPAEGRRTVEKPAPMNLPDVAGDPTLKVQTTPLVDPFEIQEQIDDPQADGAKKKKPKYPIANTIRFDFASRQFPRFAEFAFEPNAGLYYADTLPFARNSDSRFMGGGGADLWIYWRTDEQPAKELDFASARKAVESYWKRTEALKLAEQAARKLAEQAGKGKDLKTLVPNAKDVLTPTPFTWYTSGSVGGQFAQPMPSQIEGIDYAGNDFRQSVFDLQVGQAGVAVDEPNTTVYVVRLVSEEGDLSRDRFLEKVHDQETVIVAWQTNMALQQNMYTELFKHFNVKWSPDVKVEEEEE